MTVQRNWTRTLAALALGAVGAAAPMVRASAAPPVKEDITELARGAQVVVGDCPLGDWAPPVDTTCESYVIWWTQYAPADRGHPDVAGTPWHAVVEHYVDVVHPDGSFDNLVEESGGALTTGTYDGRHLRSAHMDAVDVPMLDAGSTPTGNVVHLGDFDWTAESRTYVWGADGPILGGDPHVGWFCGHANLLAHQKLTVGSVTGTVDGQSIDDLHQLVQIPDLEPADGTGYIFDNAFRIHVVARCGS